MLRWVFHELAVSGWWGGVDPVVVVSVGMAATRLSASMSRRTVWVRTTGNEPGTGVAGWELRKRVSNWVLWKAWIWSDSLAWVWICTNRQSDSRAISTAWVGRLTVSITAAVTSPGCISCSNAA